MGIEIDVVTIITGLLSGSAGGAVFGAIISHRLGIRRDRRKEINEVADRLYRALELEIENQFPNVSISDITAFRRRAGGYRLWRFNRALRQYWAAHDKYPPKQNSMGELIYPYPKEVSQAAQKLLKACSRA